MTQSADEFDLQRIDESDVTDADDAAIRRFLCSSFPADADAFSRCRCWHDCEPAYSLIHRDGETVVGHVAVVLRRIACGRVTIMVAGIQSLAVAPQFRGTGLSGRLMAEAMKEAQRRGIEYGLLLCLPNLERFYASLGWIRTNEPVTMADEKGQSAPLPEKNITMLIELSERPFPKGPIDLQGRDW